MISVSSNKEKLYGVKHGWPAMIGKYPKFTCMQLFLSEKGADNHIALLKMAKKQRPAHGTFVQKIIFVKDSVEEVKL